MKNKIFIFTAFLFSVVVICVTCNIYLNKKRYSRIPITMGSADTPLVQVEIQGKTYFLEVDFGSKFQLTLNKEILNDLEKKPYGTLEGRDAAGNTYSSPAYLIQKIQIGNHTFNNVVVKEVNEAYIDNITLFKNKHESKDILNSNLGVIGRALLEKMNLLFDFQNSAILECNNIADLQQAGYNLENLIMVPFDIGRTGFILTVTTDWNKARLSIDTGSTVSLIKSSLFNENNSRKLEHGLPYVNTSTFVIGNKDFGNMDLYLFNITQELHEIDGILGMDFLKNHIIYIDYKNRVIYIGDNKVQADAQASTI